mgnify:CR=1 FL=1
MSYDPDGRQTSPLPSGTGYDYTFTYDAMGRFEKILATGSTSPSFQYYYDPASNETQRCNWLKAERSRQR